MRNEGEILRLEQEHDDLEQQIRASTGLGGRRVRLSVQSKNDRDCVLKAIKTALNRMKSIDPAAHRHFENALCRGELLSYKPDSPISWIQ